MMDDRQGTYQIAGPNAFNRYGFIDQIPVRVYAYNNRLSGQRTVGRAALSLIKVDDARLGDTEDSRNAEGLMAVYSSRVRTLVDGVYDWSRFNSLPRAFVWIQSELATGRISPEELVRVSLRYGNLSTIRRIGALLERETVEDTLLRKLERALTPSTSLIPWIPARPKRGTGDQRWGVVWNDRE